MASNWPLRGSSTVTAVLVALWSTPASAARSGGSSAAASQLPARAACTPSASPPFSRSKCVRATHSTWS